VRRTDDTEKEKKEENFLLNKNQEGGTLSLNRHRMELEEGRSPKCT
jgi:hypothetical protein